MTQSIALSLPLPFSRGNSLLNLVSLIRARFKLSRRKREHNSSQLIHSQSYSTHSPSKDLYMSNEQLRKILLTTRIDEIIVHMKEGEIELPTDKVFEKKYSCLIHSVNDVMKLLFSFTITFQPVNGILYDFVSNDIITTVTEKEKKKRGQREEIVSLDRYLKNLEHV